MRARISKQLDTVDNIILNGEAILRKSHSSSSWDVGEHLDHLLKVAARVLCLVVNAEAVEGKGINPRGKLVLLLGWIPRGRGKSPEPVRGTKAGAPELRSALGAVRESLENVYNEDANIRSSRRVFRHHLFGGLTPREALRFLEVHNKHHLKIVRDICG